MTLRFETNKGVLYDFKGLNHNIIFAIFYYEPVQKNIPKHSILNPEYKMNYLDYLYKQEEIEGDSGDSDDDDGDGKDENEDFSRDDIDDYKIKENLYSKRGVELQKSNNYYQKNSIIEGESDEDKEGEGDNADGDTEGDEYASESDATGEYD
jgi:hypothetical protein